MKKILVTAVVILGLALGALNFHFILTDKGPRVLKKADVSFKYTFIDARGIKQHRLLTNPALLKAGLKDALD
jgi:uncharacterized protein YxeA